MRGFAPHLSEGSQWPPGPPNPQNGRSPILQKLKSTLTKCSHVSDGVGALTSCQRNTERPSLGGGAYTWRGLCQWTLHPSKLSRSVVFWFVMDFKIGLNFVELGAPEAPHNLEGRCGPPGPPGTPKTTKLTPIWNSITNKKKAGPPFQTRPLSRALQKTPVSRFVNPGPGSSGGPREAPPKPSVGLPGAPGGLPAASGTQDEPKQKPRNLK